MPKPFKQYWCFVSDVALNANVARTSLSTTKSNGESMTLMFLSH